MGAIYFLAKVEFFAPHALADLADGLGLAIGVSMSRDESGRYDEVPAYVAACSGIDIALLGAPDDHPTHESVLSIRSKTSLSFRSYMESLPEFFRTVLVQKAPNARGYADCSEELAKALIAKGFSDCKSAS